MALPANMDATWVNPATVQYNAQELRRADSTMFNGDASAFGVRGGVVRHGDTSLAVSVSAADVVTVQPGAVVVPGNNGSGNGCYRTALGAADTGALTARNATNPRITLVVFRVLDTDVVPANPGYTGRIEFIDGVAAASPVAPSLPLLAVELARITVPATGGGNATVDSSFRTYACSPEDVLPVATAARLPASEPRWGQALALDTGQLYRWNPTTASWELRSTSLDPQSYAPAYTNFGATTQQARYSVSGKICTGRVAFTIQSATAGVFGISLPLPASGSEQLGRHVLIGQGALLRTGIAYEPVVAYLASNVRAELESTTGAGMPQVTGTSPRTWQTGDVGSFSFAYEIA